MTEEKPRTRLATFGLLVLLATVLPWTQAVAVQPGTAPIDANPNDTVKLAFSALGFLIALRYRTPGRLSIPSRFMLGYAAVAFLGAFFNGAPGLLQSNGFRSARYVLMVFAITWLVTHLGRDRSLRIMMWFAAFQGGTAVLAQVAGLRPAVDGRLAGYLPNMHPNSLAIVVGIGLVIALLRLSERTTTRELVLAWTPLIVATVMTGSRTTYGAVLLALLFIVAARPARGVVLLWMGGVVTTVTLLVDSYRRTDTFGSLLTRGGSASVDVTLTGRTDGWAAALQLPDTFTEKVLGFGLSMKEVTVPGTSVPVRGVDGTWHSAYIEAGLLGVILLATALSIVVLARSNRRYLPLAAMLALLFVLESQLNDVSSGMAVVVILAAGTTRGIADDERTSAGPAVAARTSRTIR